MLLRSQASMQVRQKRCMHTEMVRVSLRTPEGERKGAGAGGINACLCEKKGKEVLELHVPMQIGQRARSASLLSRTVTRLQRKGKR